MRKLVRVVGASVDGRIAGPAGEIGFYPVTGDVVAGNVSASTHLHGGSLISGGRPRS